jgi:D-glycero-alpha-D-manno-heptose-7-phosphate kinase
MKNWNAYTLIMLIVKAPFRISLFGGSTDYVEFYEKYGSYIIGTTIDKYVYLAMRERPSILSPESVITYSEQQIVQDWNDIHNPLIREILKFREIEGNIEFNSYSDVPSRTGLGGSSSFCVGMLYLIDKLFHRSPMSEKKLAQTAIHIERVVLNEPGGIQDQIWPAYGGLNTIDVPTDGDFRVKPLAVTTEFKAELQNSMLLIYTNDQRAQDSIARSHEKTDRTAILQIAKEAHGLFLKEDISEIGKLLYKSWEAKAKISSLISNGKINQIVSDVMNLGAYGVKLLGAGGCGFVLVVCNPLAKQKITDRFRDSILDFKFENHGVSVIYDGTSYGD